MVIAVGERKAGGDGSDEGRDVGSGGSAYGGGGRGREVETEGRRAGRGGRGSEGMDCASVIARRRWGMAVDRLGVLRVLERFLDLLLE